jgi:DNA-binding SARP family transcriptional activator
MAQHLQTLGSPGVLFPTPAERIPPKGSALLAYLVIKQRPASRAELSSLLWDCRQGAKARRSLSQLIYTLRGVVSSNALVVAGENISVDADHLHSDFIDFEISIRGADYRAAYDLYQGAFLEGLPYITDEFDDWRNEISAALAADALRACKNLVIESFAKGEMSEAEQLIRRGLDIDPLDTWFCTRLVQSLAVAGHVASAWHELDIAKIRFRAQTNRIPDELGHGLEAIIESASHAAEPVQIGRPPTKLAGRTKELKWIGSAWSSARTGVCNVVVVRGEPGLGKTRLVEHAVRRMVVEGARAIMYSAAEVEEGLPYSATAGLCRSGSWVIRQGDLSEAEKSAIAGVVPDLFPEVAPSYAASRFILWEAIARCFDRAAERFTLVIVLDNYQWVDQSSRSMFGFLQQRLAERPVIFITVGRGIFNASGLDEKANSVRVIDLLPLSDEECDFLISEFESGQKTVVPSAVKEILKKKIGGRPLLLLEALQHYACNTDEEGPSLPPLTRLDALVISRLDRLTPNAQRLVSAAAVLNRDMHLFQIGRIAGLDPESAAASADELIDSAIIENSSAVRFQHDLLRDVTVRWLSTPQRLRWHYRAAEELVTSGSTRYAEIAYHYEECGELKSALKYARLSARNAYKLHAYHDVDQAYKRMLRCSSGSDLEQARAQYFQHLAGLGLFKEAEDLLESVEPYFERASDSDGQILCQIVRYSRTLRCGNSSRADDADVGRILRLLAEHSPQRLAQVVWQLADPLKSSGENDFLESFSEHLISLATERALDDAAVGETLAVASLITMFCKGYSAAERIASCAVEAALRTDKGDIIARSMYARGTVALVAGRLPTTIHDYDTVLTRFSNALPEVMLTRLKTNYSVAMMEQKRFDEGIEMAQRALREFDHCRRPYAYGNIALICLRRGDPDGARKYAELAMNTQLATTYSWIAPHVAAIHGLACLQEGDVDAAERYSHQASGQIGLATGVIDCSNIYELAALTKHARGDTEAAGSLLDAGVAFMTPRDYLASCRLALYRHSLSGLTDHTSLEIVLGIQRMAYEREAWSLTDLVETALSSIAAHRSEDCTSTPSHSSQTAKPPGPKQSHAGSAP